jgi:Family of unknown function (DUF5519)
MEIRDLIQEIERNVLLLDGVTAMPHPRFGGRQFDWNNKEIGHIHWNGDLDILFNKSVHDSLLTAGLATEHKYVPAAGWITFPVLKDRDIHHGLELLKFSYYQKRKRTEREKDFSSFISSLQLPENIRQLI